MSIAPVALLIPYVLGLLTFAAFGAFALYRLFRFGAPSAGSWLMVLTFCLGTALLVAASLWQMTILDWPSAGLELNGSSITAEPYAYPALD